jgi:hypothetical protein
MTGVCMTGTDKVIMINAETFCRKAGRSFAATFGHGMQFEVESGPLRSNGWISDSGWPALPIHGILSIKEYEDAGRMHTP